MIDCINNLDKYSNIYFGPYFIIIYTFFFDRKRRQKWRLRNTKIVQLMTFFLLSMGKIKVSSSFCSLIYVCVPYTGLNIHDFRIVHVFYISYSSAPFSISRRGRRICVLEDSKSSIPVIWAPSSSCHKKTHNVMADMFM